MNVRVKLFGKAKDLNEEGIINLTFNDQVCVAEVRAALIQRCSDGRDEEYVKQLISDCALGSSDKILIDSETIDSSVHLVLLPPVCGG